MRRCGSLIRRSRSRFDFDGGRDPSGVEILRVRKPVRKANRLVALAPWARRSKYEQYLEAWYLLRKWREGEKPAGAVKRAKSRAARELRGGEPGPIGRPKGGGGVVTGGRRGKLRFFVKNREAVLGASLRLADSRGGSPYMDWGDAGVPTRAPSFTFSMWAVIQRFGVWRPFTNSF